MVERRQLRQECQKCLRSRHGHSKMSTMPRVTELIVRGESVVSKDVVVCRRT